MFEFYLSVVPIPAAPILAALVLMLMDIVTGFAQAVKNKVVDSTKMRDGLWHKLGFVAAIVLGIVMEEVLANVTVDVGVQIPTTGVICGFIVVTEVVSIAENIAQLNPVIGEVFGKLLEIKSNSGKGEE